MENENLSKDRVVLIKGAGEKASAVAHRLYGCGFERIVMTDLPVPLAERRQVSFSEAIIDWRKEVCGVVAQRADFSIEMIGRIWSEGKIAVLADAETRILNILRPDILIDAIMAKRNTGTRINDAPLVIALGPGFVAGKDCHFVVETNPVSPFLGDVISEGKAEEDTGVPTPFSGLDLERIIKAPKDGILELCKKIGDRVKKDEVIAKVDGSLIKAPISGVVWGVLRDGVRVKKGQKIGDIDPRARRKSCFEISDQARVIANGVLKAVFMTQDLP